MMDVTESATSGQRSFIAQLPHRTEERDGIVPVRFELLVGGYFGTSYAVKLQQNGLWYNRCRHSEPSPRAADGPQTLQVPTLEAWRRFRAELEALNVWTWRRHYPNIEGVWGGYGFQFSIEYRESQFICGGDNCFPGVRGEPVPITARTAGDPFDRFCATVSRLIGRAFR